MSNKEDLQAINDFVQSRSAPAAGAPASVISSWQNYKAQWSAWYPGVMSSFYVSDSDLAHGKAIRDAIMRNNDPDGWEYVQKTAADKPGERTPYADRPDAPPTTKKPWEKKGLTYSGKHKTVEDVKTLQRRINAAGYQPPLKIDGDYGEKTKAGERWLDLKERTDGAAVDAVKQITGDYARTPPKAKPAAKPAEKPAEKPPEKAGISIFGAPVNFKTVGAAAAGAVGGFLAAGPIGGLVGGPLAFLGVASFTKGA